MNVGKLEKLQMLVSVDVIDMEQAVEENERNENWIGVCESSQTAPAPRSVLRTPPSRPQASPRLYAVSSPAESIIFQSLADSSVHSSCLFMSPKKNSTFRSPCRSALFASPKSAKVPSPSETPIFKLSHGRS